jgi:outer membrane protein TolC
VRNLLARKSPLLFAAIMAAQPCYAQILPTELRPQIAPQKEAVTLVGAVKMAERQYPQLLQVQAEAASARADVRVQKIREYMPRTPLMYETVVGSHNRLTQTLFGNEVLPTTPGPGPDSVRMKADVFGGSGFLIDWNPLDFGLHKARIEAAKSRADVEAARFLASVLDTQVEAATRYLDALVMREQIAVAEANVNRFEEFSRVVHAQVESGLQPGADASLADAQLANARNELIRARLSYDLSRASLAQILGMAGQALDLNPGGLIVVTEPRDNEPLPIFQQHPLLREAAASITSNVAQRKVLSKEGYPTLRWLGGMNFRGTTFITNRGDVPAKDISSLFPYVPNWNVGLMVEWTPSDLVRIGAEKRVVDYRITAARHAYDTVLQALQTQDVQSRARVRAAIELAANMPVQVSAAELAARQAQARYQAGLATVAQVAEANQLLADSRVKLAVANVGVWRAMLQQASVTGNLTTFLSEAEKATQREVR